MLTIKSACTEQAHATGKDPAGGWVGKDGCCTKLNKKRHGGGWEGVGHWKACAALP